MKKYLPLGIALACITTGSFVSAEEVSLTPDINIKITPTSSTSKQKRENLQDRKRTIEENMAERSAKMEERKADMIGQKENRLNKIEERKTTMGERKEARLQKISEKAKANISKIIERVDTKFTDALERLSKIDAKIETRIQKFADKGINVSESKALFVTAKADLVTAKAKVASLEASIKDKLTAEEVSKDAIKELVAEAKESIKTAHASYIKVVASLSAKGGLKDEKSASSTKKIKIETTATTTVN